MILQPKERKIVSGILNKMKTVYSAIETTCFGIYWPFSGFYNIKEESIKL